MTTLREAAQQALEALEFMADEWGFTQKANRPERGQAIAALRSALEQPEQEPVAWACFKNGELQTELIGTEADVDFWCASNEPEMEGMVKGSLYTHPPRREWRGLTEEEINEATFHPDGCMNTHIEFARAIEAALKEKNHD
jgi:hypothetical protein